MTLCLCTCYSHCLECPSSLPCLGNSHSSLKTCLSLSPPPGSLSESSRGTCSIFSHFCFPPIPTSGRGLWFLGCTGERGSLTFHWVEIWVSRALGKFSSGCGPWWFLIKVFLPRNALWWVESGTPRPCSVLSCDCKENGGLKCWRSPPQQRYSPKAHQVCLMPQLPSHCCLPAKSCKRCHWQFYLPTEERSHLED